MTDYILVIDAGTTGVQASLFDIKTFKMFGNTKVEFQQHYPKSGFVEHDPNEIWSATRTAVQQMFVNLKKESKSLQKPQIVGIGISNQRETCLGWNLKTFDSPFRAIVWQDRRTADFCHKLKTNSRLRKFIQNTTGLICDPYFSATKMRWMLKNNTTLKNWSQKKELALGTIDSFLVWKLTGHKQFVTDHTNASRTMLYSLEAGDYSKELLKFFQIPQKALAKILPSSGLFGKTKGLDFLPDDIPICSVMGDQQSALYGQLCRKKGNTKITYGTGAFILMNTGKSPIISKSGLLTTVAYSSGKKRTFALEGSAFIAGAAIQFLRDNFEWFKDSEYSEELALLSPRDKDILFVPAFVGLGSPYWNPHAKGTLFGLTRGTHKSQIVRAVLESIAFQNVSLLKLIQKDSTMNISKIGVDGGGSKNNFMMQFQSDILHTKLLRPQNLQTTSLGVGLAAYEALYGTIFAYEQNNTDFKPKMPLKEAKSIVQTWTKAVECTDHFYKKGS